MKSETVREIVQHRSGRSNPEIVRGDDGTRYLVWDGQAPPEEDDEGFVGGGVRVVGRRRLAVEGGGEEAEVLEIETLAAGGSFRTGFGETEAAKPYRPPTDRTDRLALGLDLWKHDPLGGAIVSLTTFFAFGRGLSIQSVGMAEKVLRKFWGKNELDERSKVLDGELTAFGEVFLKLVVHAEEVENPVNPRRALWRPGHVEVVPIAPEIVHSIDHSPTNIEDINFYRLRYQTGEEEGSGRKKIVEETHPPIDKFRPGQDQAAVVHLKINATSNDVFGTSDLIRVREWLANYKEFLRDGVLINKLYRSPCFDITIKDGDDSDVRRAIRRYQDWTIGSNPVHNDKEEWQILEFRGANVSQEDSRRALLLIIAAGTNIPEYMLADGANSNLASARAQQLPAIKRFERRQETWRAFWRKVFEFVLDVAEVVGNVPLDAEEDFEGDAQWMVDVKFPPISLDRDEEVANANRTAIEDGYMSPQTAASRAGVDYEREQELRLQAAIDEEVQAVKLEAFRQSEDFQKMKQEAGVDEGPETNPANAPTNPTDDEELPDEENGPAEGRFSERVEVEGGGE